MESKFVLLAQFTIVKTAQAQSAINAFQDFTNYKEQNRAPTVL